MSENAIITQHGGTLMENEYVKELFGVLQENGKDATGLTALIAHIAEMENFIKQAEFKTDDMQAQLNEMQEIQNHPIQYALQKADTALEARITEMKAQLAILKTNFITGCKNILATFKETGTAVLDKLASFFNIKGNLQALKNSTVRAADQCDRACVKIETFSKNYHTAGRALKNMARIIVGKEPIDTIKASGKLTKTVSTPYRAKKACLLGIRKQCDKMIIALNNLENTAETNHNAQAVKPKKPKLMERLNAKKNEIKEREWEVPALDRSKTVQAEI